MFNVHSELACVRRWLMNMIRLKDNSTRRLKMMKIIANGNWAANREMLTLTCETLI